MDQSEIDLILNLYFEEKMTIEEIERVTPFDSITLNALIKNDEISNKLIKPSR